MSRFVVLTRTGLASGAEEPPDGFGARLTKYLPTDIVSIYTIAIGGLVSAKPGPVTFAVKNIGHVAHDFRIDGKQTPLIEPGKTAQLAVSFSKSGKYPYLCTVPGHAAAGMKGLIKVT